MPNQRPNGRQSSKKQCNFNVVNDAVAHRRLVEGRPQGARFREACEAIAQRATCAHGKAHGRGLNGAPSTKGKAAIAALRQGHGRSERSNGKKAAANANQNGAKAK